MPTSPWLMHRQQRLRQRRDFSAVFRGGRAFVDGPLVVRVQANPDAPAPRFGFAVSRQVGGAVVRNRVKRRLRAAARLSGATGHADVVVIARSSAASSAYADLDAAMRRLLRQAGLLAGEQSG